MKKIRIIKTSTLILAIVLQGCSKLSTDLSNSQVAQNLQTKFNEHHLPGIKKAETLLPVEAVSISKVEGFNSLKAAQSSFPIGTDIFYVNKSSSQEIGIKTDSTSQAVSSNPVGGRPPCSCSVTTYDVRQPDGQMSQCYMERGFWLVLSSITRSSCNGAYAASGLIVGPPPGECSIASNITITGTGSYNCVHESDTNRNGVVSLEEQGIFDQINAPVDLPNPGHIDGTSVRASDRWHATFMLLFLGSSTLCGGPTARVLDPEGYAACLSLPLACQRLNAVSGIDPISARQIYDAFEEYDNNLNQCQRP